MAPTILMRRGLDLGPDGGDGVGHAGFDGGGAGQAGRTDGGGVWLVLAGLVRWGLGLGTGATVWACSVRGVGAAPGGVAKWLRPMSGGVLTRSGEAGSGVDGRLPAGRSRSPQLPQKVRPEAGAPHRVQERKSASENSSNEISLPSTCAVARAA